MPRFSIVVPAYNAEDTLAETLDAVIAQTFDDWECVVVDDGSTDTTLATARSYAEKDARIRVVHQENQGTAGAYNAGVRAATGTFVVLCSADDIVLPEHLVEMTRFIECEGGYDIYSTNGYFWRPEDGLRQLVYPPGTRDSVMSLTLTDVIRVCFFSVGAAYRRDLFERVGGYRQDVFGEDYDFWLRAMASGARHRYLPEALSLHRVSRTQKSADLDRAYRSDIRLVTDLRDAFDLSAEESAAVDQTVRDRERMIERRAEPSIVGGARRSLSRVARRILGDDRVNRVTAWLRSNGPGRPSNDG